MDSSLQPKTILDPWCGEQFFILGAFIDGFGVTARGLTWFPCSLKDGSEHFTATQNHFRPMVWGTVFLFWGCSSMGLGSLPGVQLGFLAP